MTQPNDREDSSEAIRQQFATLQAEMQRVMADRPAAESPGSAPGKPETAIDFERIEKGLEDLRRDADRLRARMVYSDDLPGASETIIALRERIEGIAKHSEFSISRLTREVQDNREAIAAVSLHLETLARRRSPGWLVALAILLGAVVIGGAVLLSEPGRLQMLIDRVGGVTDSPKPHAEETAPPPPVPVPAPIPVPAPAPTVAALPPAAPPPSAEPPAVQPAPPPAPEAVAAASPPPPVPAATPAPPPPAAEPPVAAMPAPAPAAEPPVAAAAPAPVPATEPPAPAAVPPAVPAAEPPVAAAAPASAPTPAPPPAPAPAGKIVLHAKSDAWVEVRNRQGELLLGRLLRAGETWTVPDQHALVLTTGNAGGLELLVDGKPAPSLGAVGAVRRDIPLDAALIREGHYGPASTTSLKASTASR